MVCKVVNKYHSDFDVNIQRGTMWGNPHKDKSREENIAAFRVDFISKIRSGEINKYHLETLRNMRLGCTCKPKACHGDIIAELVNRYFQDIPTLEGICK